MRTNRNNSEYVFRPEDLLGPKGQPETIKCLKAAVKLLEDEHLNNIEKARPALEGLCRCMGFKAIMVLCQDEKNKGKGNRKIGF